MIYVDMDGVLANFNKAGCATFGIEYPKNTRLWHTWLYEQAGLSLQAWFDRVLSDPDIWDRIEPYPWTADLVQCLDAASPGWKILSVGFRDPKCWASKVQWVTDRLFPVTDLHRLILVGGNKFELAREGDLLIDDSLDNLNKWKLAGGQIFKWVEYTEDCPDKAAAQIEVLREFLLSRSW